MTRQCTARSKQSGQRCKRAPIVGGSVCKMHGGGAPQVQRTAQERIAELVDPAITALQLALSHRDVHAAIKAARDLLDRAGHAAVKKHEVEARRKTLEQLIHESYSLECEESVRLDTLSPTDVLNECRKEHGSACASLDEHAKRRAQARRAKGETDGPHERSRDQALASGYVAVTAIATAPTTVQPAAVAAELTSDARLRLHQATVQPGEPIEALGADGSSPRSRRPVFPYSAPRSVRDEG